MPTARLDGTTVAHRPSIVGAGRQLRDVAADAMRALQQAQEGLGLFQQTGALVRVRADRTGRTIVEPVSVAMMTFLMARAADWIYPQFGGKVKMGPPPQVVAQTVLAAGAWPFRELAGIIEAPTLRGDGVLLSRPGYDVTSRLLYLPPPDLVVPPVAVSPSDDDRVRALAILTEPLIEFPFVDEASRANALALMLTPVLRAAIPGLVPLAAITATSQGSGKGLLVDLCSLIVTGRTAGVLSETRSDEELRKRITSVLRAGHAVALLDNAQRQIASPVFAALLTAEIWEDRLLGFNQMLRLPNRTCWAITGNALRLGGDIPRRAFLIAVDAKCERPWERTGFKVEDLRTHVRERRGELLWAALALARAWFGAGCPRADVPMMGSFTEWTRVVGGILAHAGVRGFLGNIEQVHTVLSETSVGWEGFLRAWQAELGGEPATVAEVAAALTGPSAFRDALPDELLDLVVGERVDRRRLGIALRRRMGVRFAPDGLRLELADIDTHRNARRWRVVVDDPQPPIPEAGTEPEPQPVAPVEPAAPTPVFLDFADTADDGRREFLLDFGRSLGFPPLPFAPGRSVVAGEPAWVRFAARSSAEDLGLVLAALQALADAQVEGTR